MLQRSYQVEFETDSKTKQVTARLPTLNHTADFGDTAEEAHVQPQRGLRYPGRTPRSTPPSVLGCSLPPGTGTRRAGDLQGTGDSER